MLDQTRRILIAIAIFACAVLLYRQWRVDQPGYGLFQLLGGQKPPVEEPARKADGHRRLSNEDVPILLKTSEESAKLAETVLPCVVSINTSDLTPKDQVINGLVYRTMTTQRGIGSGVIVSKEGHIITNFHVIKDSVEVQVRMADGTRYGARFVGADPGLDIAVIQIIGGKKDFPTLAFADSEKVRAGELVFAIGSPFALNGSVSRGIISATQRQLSDSVSDLLQTDTVINPGNSGGPLVNVRGEIVGINVIILTPDKGEQFWNGVGLAVPSNDASEALQAIITKGVPTSGYVGIEVFKNIVSVNSTLGGATGGAMVENVMPGSPAALAGLKAGDVITKFGGRGIEDIRTLMVLIRKAKPGQQIPIVVVRDEKLVNLTATIQPRPVGK